MEATLALDLPLPVENLTALAHAGRLRPAIVALPGGNGQPSPIERALEAMARGLFRRRCRHVLVTGKRGVGKTTLVRELARRAAQGQPGFLRERRFVSIDGRHVPPENSPALLAAILAGVPDERETVLCLDDLGQLLRGPHNTSNKPVLRAALASASCQVIGILSQWDYDELLASDAEVADLCTRVQLEEPEEELALAIARDAAQVLAGEYRCAIELSAADRAVRLGTAYVWNDAHPAKAIKILERSCEDLDYERSQLAAAAQEITADHVVRTVADLTRIPVETLTGERDLTDYEALLSASIVGQPEAVQAVASELRLIKAGLNEPGKPASVMLFCGMNGVGKTELAKKLAQVYSASKRLQVYTMGNFVEPHSVSGIIGVPAGYVGHDQGGRIVNDLNSDPYGVFLLDEVEKAHPDVMKPFLNLFDEGWIVDQRGVMAYADRAIFILTSNAGYETVAQMSQAGRPMEDIVEHVKQVLSRCRNERSGQPVLSQAFLARLKRIVVFRPLAEESLYEIARLQWAAIERRWQHRRGRSLQMDEATLRSIARESQRLNEVSNGREGARSIRRLLCDALEAVVR
jgi:ATP-dependent Clp protease ATP-binding subunit ClpA